MKTNQAWRIPHSEGTARSVLECGSPLPLCHRPSASKSARGLAQSKTWRCITAAALLFIVVTDACAQNYSIDWHTIDGGGGTSTGGMFSVSGTIGQPDAGTMNGGNYSLAGGFWEIISAIQTPGAPLLTIHFTTGNRAVVSWPSSSTGFTLQQNANLNTGSWGTPSEAVTDNGTNKFITLNSPTGNRFYRLFKP